jgi:hypothetical protein
MRTPLRASIADVTALLALAKSRAGGSPANGSAIECMPAAARAGPMVSSRLRTPLRASIADVTALLALAKSRTEFNPANLSFMSDTGGLPAERYGQPVATRSIAQSPHLGVGTRCEMAVRASRFSGGRKSMVRRSRPEDCPIGSVDGFAVCRLPEPTGAKLGEHLAPKPLGVGFRVLRPDHRARA